MAKFIMLIGLPGSGKSTYATRYKSKYPNTAVVSSDEIREELFGDVNDQTHNGEVFTTMLNRTREFLKADIDVIYDATNINRKRRTNLLKELPDDTVKIAVIFAVAFELCREQNENRSRQVPYEVLERMYKSFQVPSHGEGFNKIEIEGSPTYKEEIARRQIAEIENLAKNCSQDNSHHRFTIGEHCLHTWAHSLDIIKCENLSFSKAFILSQACRYHDIGKWFCKHFYNAKGEHTNEAHYYNHENVGAYIYLSTMYATPTLFGIEEYHQIILIIANLIANHMVFWTDEGTINKRKQLYTEEFWQLLEWVHECDMNAH